MTASVVCWLSEPPSPALSAALDRLARTENVERVAVMPDAHVAEDVCIGTVTATSRRLFPAAVGGDIGCGMLSLRIGAWSYQLEDRDRAACVLSGFATLIPKLVHRTGRAAKLPAELLDSPLSASSLEALKTREGRLSFMTLGRGNHFLELQRDTEGDLWLVVHSGSRSIGPKIRDHHLAKGTRDPTGLIGLESDSVEGRAYFNDARWAGLFAKLNRRAILDAALVVLADTLSAEPDWGSLVGCDHNHVRREEHKGRPYWVHRKGAMGLPKGTIGVLPGSMGTSTFHVAGRGNTESMGSSAHGAGRRMSRSEARQHIGVRELLAEVSGVWFDHRLMDGLREEAPSAYKDIAAVLRAGRDLVRVVRRLEPVLVYKGI